MHPDVKRFQQLLHAGPNRSDGLLEFRMELQRKAVGLREDDLEWICLAWPNVEEEDSDSLPRQDQLDIAAE